MIGGGGERKTLRLVAQYADACNVFGDAVRIHHKYEVLREHCEALGRNPDEIERSTLQTVKLKTDDRPGDAPSQIVDWFGELSDAGAQHVIFSVRDVWDPRMLEIVGRDVIPALHALP
jgi:alkanesulfonate monooxygenase